MLKTITQQLVLKLSKTIKQLISGQIRYFMIKSKNMGNFFVYFNENIKYKNKIISLKGSNK